MIRPTTIALSLVTLSLGAIAGLLAAGPLNPPAGPVTGTYKTLTEVEPRIAINQTNTPGDGLNYTYRITQPGSYYFTGHLTGTATDFGLQIAASDVTIDLNGFTFRGVPGAISAIVTDSGRSNITIRNGTIANWPAAAIALTTGGSGANSVIQDIRSISNAGQNIVIGANSRVSRCIVENAGSYAIFAVSGRCLIESCSVRTAVTYGIIANESCVVHDCTVSGVTGTGISAVQGTTVSNCTATACVTGFYIESGSTVQYCTARSNNADGFYLNAGTSALFNTAQANGVTAADGAGIHVFGADSRIEGNNLVSNDKGLRVESAGNIIKRNTSSGNTVFNWDITAGNALAPNIPATPNAAAV
ncbi:MAG: right-handed parallel beta-helix repeat-containing protein, partial [Planctomycetota bacterium]